MSVFHLKTGGSKSGTTASTPDDWTNGNCYGSWVNVTAALAVGADGDSIIVDDEMFVAPANSASGVNINGTVYVRSRSGDPLISGIIGSSATGALWLTNSTTHSANVVYQNLTLRKSVTHTDTARPVIHHMSQRTGNVTFTNCEFSDINISTVSGANWYYGLCRNDSAAGYGTVTRFEDCGFRRITGTFFGYGVLFAYTADSTAKRIEVVRPTIRTIAGVNLMGGFVVSNGSQLRFWDVDLDGWTASTTGETTSGGVLKINTYGVGSRIYGRRATFRNVQVDANVADTMISTSAPFDIKGVVGEHVTNNSFLKTAGQGALFMGIGAAAQGRIEDIRAYDCHANYGPAAYWSNGAGGTYRNIWAEACSAGTGIIYKGGGGDLSGDIAVVKNCVQRSAADEPNLITDALCFYGHIHASTGDHNTDISLKNLMCQGNTYLAGKGAVLFNNPNATYTLNCKAEGVVVRDNAIGIMLDGAAVNLTATGCNLVGGVAGFVESQASGTLSQSGTIDVAAAVIGKLAANAAIGDRWPSSVRVAA